ncbi:MAG TPA: sigma-70 family RNA polymerase sigma factor [Puia sp.]|nr:sigma-70 family RNA polymerase sigma factor [Puia sp.]
MLPAACHTEKELARRLIEGDLAAFNEIYQKYFHPVYCNALKITREVPVAEDVLQEVFIALWEKRQTIDPEKSLAGWLFILCYHKSINILRKKLRESLVYKELQQPEDSSREEEIKYVAQWKILENALSCLSPQRRRVFELCKLQGKTYEEAAMELRISKYTVKEYLSAAIVSIKEYSLDHPLSSVALIPLIFLCQ